MPQPMISLKPMMGKDPMVNMMAKPMMNTMRTPRVRRLKKISRPRLTLETPLVRTPPQALALLAPEHFSQIR